MSEYVFRYAPGYGCDMSALMDGGRETVGEYFASDATDHYGTLHEEIVRCSDCKCCDEEHYGAWGRVWHCEQFGDVKPDGYCAWGARADA